ncbi:MAG: DHH family phosphoesterase [Thermoplasmatota archaeon]
MKYMIVGWNETAESLARAFEYRGFNYKTYTQNIREVEQNKIDKFNIKNLDQLYKSVKNDSILFLLQSKLDDRIEVLKKVREQSKGCKTISITFQDEVQKLKEYHIDEVIVKDELFSSSLLKSLDEIESVSNSETITDIIKESKKEISIFLHNNPDPDAFASAMAFEKICEKYNKNFGTYYSGNIGHPENEIIVESTEIKMMKIEQGDIKTILNDSDIVVFLDFAKPGYNNLLPEETKADIIIDHHRTNKDVKQTGYAEIRTDVGATSTLMTKHLLNLGFDISPILATCLLYGIKVDTDNFTKNIFVQDFKMISFLSAIADKDVLDIFESPPINPGTVSALGTAIVNRKYKHENIVAYAGEIPEKDDIPQIANILSKERDISNVLVYGLLNNKIYMSARSKELKLDIGKRMKKAFSSIGNAGGHQHSAGGVIDFSEFDGIEEAKDRIEEIFTKEVVKD